MMLSSSVSSHYAEAELLKSLPQDIHFSAAQWKDWEKNFYDSGGIESSKEGGRNGNIRRDIQSCRR